MYAIKLQKSNENNQSKNIYSKMKIVNATILRKAKALEPANGKHKCIILYKKVGWPNGHKKLKANHKSRVGEQSFDNKFHVLDDTEDAKSCAMWLKDFNEKILQPSMRKKNLKVGGVKINQFDHVDDTFQKLTAGMLGIVQLAV